MLALIDGDRMARTASEFPVRLPLDPEKEVFDGMAKEDADDKKR